MKCKFLFLLLALGSLMMLRSTNALGNDRHVSQDSLQVKKVTLNMQNQPLDDILRAIDKQIGMDYGYQVNSEIDKKRRFSLNVKNCTLELALERLFATSDYSYVIEKGRIIIVKRQKQVASTKEMLTVRGKVVDSHQVSLPGATVLVAGTTIGVVTDEDGNFAINVEAGRSLEARFIGFKPVQKKITKAEEELILALEPDAQEMDEVVVTGIFNKEKTNFTGAYTEVSSEDLKMYRGQNLVQTLSNIDPGLQIAQNNGVGSNPNVLPEITIRGSSSLPVSMEEMNQNVQAQLNTPLIILDGFEVSLQQMVDLNDEDIENITILKDASATAIYGSRGANGVIVITTKKPEAGKLRFFVQGGVNIEIPDLTSYNLFKAEEKLEFEREMGLYGDSGLPTDLPLYQTYYDRLHDIRNGVETYWLSQPLQVGVGQRYNARLEGGSQEFRWSASLGYNQTVGVMKGSKRSALNGNINISYSFKNLIFQNSLTLSSSKGQDSKYGSFSDYASLNPYWRIYDEQGRMYSEYRFSNQGNPVDNPLYDAQFDTKLETENNNLTENFSIDWNITKGLNLRGRFSYSKGSNTEDTYYPAAHSNFDGYDAEDFFRRGSYDYTTGQTESLSGSATLTYSKTFHDKHQLDIGLDYSIQHSESYNYNFAVEGFADERFDFLSNAAAYEQDGKPGGSESVSRSVGFTGNLTYTYNNCYFLDLSYRLDGSSQFGSDKRFAPFWSAGLGWNVHNLPALKNQLTLSKLRIRTSYGVQGSQNFAPYQALTTYEYSTDDRYMYFIPALIMGYGNEDLKWQTSRSFNAGLDFALWNNRINGSVDVYTRSSADMLSSVDISLATGFSSYIDNIGKIKNYGFEASLSGYVVRNTETGWIFMITARLAHNKNVIKELSDAIKEQTEFYRQQNTEIGNMLYEGHSTSSIYVVPSLGIAPSTGQEVFLDQYGNPTYEWNANAKALAGDTNPKYTGNASAMLQYKGLSINLSFGYHWGGQQYNNTLLSKVEVTRTKLRENLDKRVRDERWMKPGDRTFYKSYYTLDGEDAAATRMSSRFVQDDNVFQLQSASLQYNWTSRWVKEKLNAQAINLSVNMSDLFYVSTIKRERGTGYPFSRQMSFALSINF